MRYISYTTSAGQVVNTASNNVLNFGTKISDDNNLVSNAATNFLFTADTTGLYSIGWYILTGSASKTGPLDAIWLLNGSTGFLVEYVFTAEAYGSVGIYIPSFYMTSGDTLQPKLANTSDANVQVYPSTPYNLITIGLVAT